MAVFGGRAGGPRNIIHLVRAFVMAAAMFGGDVFTMIVHKRERRSACMKSCSTLIRLYLEEPGCLPCLCIAVY